MIIQRSKSPDYNHEEHRYSAGGIIYRSSTQIVEQFTNHFQTEEMAKQMVYRYGRTEQYWITKWKEKNDWANTRGTLKHDQEEQFLYNQGYTLLNGREFTVHNRSKVPPPSIPKDYCYYPDGCYPELMFWDHDWHIAGRSDKPTIETINGCRFMHIEDYKTNQSLDQYSFNHPRNGYTMMTGPLSHIMDCNYWHYVLQLSLYQFMAEYFGFLPGVRRIIHFPHEIEGLGTPDPKPYELPYLRSEVLAMLAHLKLQRWLN